MSIIIDPGHGGARPDGKPGLDHGASAGGMIESLIAAHYGCELAAALSHIGVDSDVTHLGADERLTLSGRARFANERKATAFVSVHCNASASTSAAGFQVFHCAGSTRGLRLANAIFRRVVPHVSPKTDRTGVFPDASIHCGNRRLKVLRATSMPAVLVELDFLTSPGGRLLLQDAAFRKKIAAAIAAGIRDWLPSPTA